MNRFTVLGFTTLALLSTCAAQVHTCKFTQASSTERRDGISVGRISVISTSAESEATVIVPDGNDVLPGIAFSHSSIHTADKNADLIRFAFALARAGAASILLDGTIDWQTPNDDSARDPHLMACASQWLLQNARLDKHRLLFAGPTGIGDYDAARGYGKRSWCEIKESACDGVNAGWMNLGQTDNDSRKLTDEMMNAHGQLVIARDFEKHLKLKPITPEQLSEALPGRSEIAKTR